MSFPARSVAKEREERERKRQETLDCERQEENSEGTLNIHMFDP